MSASLRDTISRLASEFAAGVLGTIRGSSLEEILSETSGAERRGPGRPRKTPVEGAAAPVVARPARGRSKGGRLGRRSAKALAHVVDAIASLLSSHPKGLRAEQIRAQLGLSAKEMPRPIAKALASRRITKTGEKRATTYFVGGGGGGAKTAKRSRRSKPAARSARPAAKKRGRRTSKRRPAPGKPATAVAAAQPTAE